MIRKGKCKKRSKLYNFALKVIFKQQVHKSGCGHHQLLSNILNISLINLILIQNLYRYRIGF